jgi:hypothetical protein
MIFDIKEKKDVFLEEMYTKAMRELNKFYGLNWKYNLPNIVILKSRREINQFYGDETEGWVVAFAKRRTVFILDRKKYAKESTHKYSRETYGMTLKHELGHLFYEILSQGNNKPSWLNEGLQLFVAGQLKFKKPIETFSNFIGYYAKFSKGVYEESGFAVQFLFKKFGKEKLINLIKSLNKIHSEKDFKIIFKKIYGFELNYKEINKRYKSIK